MSSSIVIKIRTELQENQESVYKAFAQKITPNADNILGVRTPIVRKLAKKVLKTAPLDYIKAWDYIYHEEFCLLGMVLAKVSLPLSEKENYLKRYSSEIQNWASCDTFVASFKLSDKEKEELLPFLLKYRSSTDEFELRFVIVMLLWHYLTPQYYETVINFIDAIHVEHYYTNMAIAWLISILYFKDKQYTLSYLEHHHLNEFTYHKALQKITESKLATSEEKQFIRGLM